MNIQLRQFCQALVLSCLSASAWASGYQEARTWLERMATAMNQMSYQGTFVYMHGDEVETMRITHVLDEDGVRERMYSLSGPQREVIRDKDGVRCVMSEDQAIMEDPMVARSIFPEIPLQELDEASSQYRFELGGHARIAGHRGKRITIYPKDEYRYGYDLWLEEHSGLLLRWVLYDSKRKTLAKLMFTDLKLGAEVEFEELLSPAPADQFVILQTGMPDKQVRSSLAAQWQPPDLPPGFRLSARSYQGEVDGVAFEHLVYSDGLATVSVYIESQLQSSAVAEGLSRLGTANAFSRRAGSRQVTAIGEVPPITVEAIGNAFAAPVAAAD